MYNIAIHSLLKIFPRQCYLIALIFDLRFVIGFVPLLLGIQLVVGFSDLVCVGFVEEEVGTILLGVGPRDAL